MRYPKLFQVFLLITGAGIRGGEPALELTVYVYNDAGLTEGKVSHALIEAGFILRQAGFSVKWVRCAVECAEYPDPRLFVFRIISAPRATFHDSALGFALPFTEGGNHATAFLSKVSRFSEYHASAGADDGSVLGSVIAHELGHLLLRSNQHGDGIMRAFWQLSDARKIAHRRLIFTPEQAQVMRQVLGLRLQAFRQQQTQRSSTR